MTAPACSLIAAHGIPAVVLQAMDDVRLPSTARFAMWHLRNRLDIVRFNEVKVASLASEMRVKERTLGDALARLAAEGYLDVHAKQRPKAYRFPWSRMGPQTLQRAA